MTTRKMSSFRDSLLTKLLCFRRHFSLISTKTLEIKIQDLHNLCASDGPNKEAQSCLNNLVSIVRRSSSAQIAHLEPATIISCAIKIFSLFEHDSSNYSDNCHRRVATICYHFLLKTFAPNKPRKLVQAVLDSVAREKLWKAEETCCNVVLDMIRFGVSGTLLAKSLRDKILMEDEDAPELVKILSRLLKVYQWPQNQETDAFVQGLLHLYHDTIDEELSTKLGICLKYTIRNLGSDNLPMVLRCMCGWIVNRDDIQDALVLSYGSLLEDAAERHQTKTLSKSLTSDLFPLLLDMINSPNKLVNLLGHRVLQRVVDRHDNAPFFSSPLLFFEDEPTELEIGKCLHEDRLFFKTHRELIHDSVVKSIVNHCTSCLNLEATYCTVCLFAVEIPCGFTAAALACLAMNMQDMTLEEVHHPRQVGYHIHAAVGSIMSLLCLVHEAKVLAEYVNKIISERMQWAPHLNPPLLVVYEHASHDVLWNKPDLFFVDWEVRYGLWKKFRLQDEERMTTLQSL